MQTNEAVYILCIFKTGIFLDCFYMSALHSTLLHLPPLTFHCVGGSWDRTQDSCGLSIGCQTLYSHSATSHPHINSGVEKSKNLLRRYLYLQGEVAWVDQQVYLMPRLTSSPPIKKLKNLLRRSL
jgi:hypothetical protein